MVLRHAEVHESRIPADPAGAVPARYSRDPTGDGLPVLSQFRGGGRAIERAQHCDMHELPYASGERQSQAAAGAGELEKRSASRVGVALSHGRLRLLQPLSAREPGHQLFQLPRRRQSHVDGSHRPTPQHGVVPGLPSAPRELSAAG